MTYAPETTADKPNGPAAAALIGSGIGVLVLGLLTTISEVFPNKAGETSAFDFSKLYGIGSGVGPLSGKVVLAVVAYFVGWAIFAFLWRGRDVRFGMAFTVSLLLIAAGFLLTFPPFFDLLKG